MSTTGAEGDSERRVIDAARERRSARIERDEAAAETSFCGLLSALVERRERVTLLTDVGDTVALTLVALGRDGVVGTIFGAILIQTVENGLVMTNANPYLYPLVTSAIIFFAVLVDSQRSRILDAMNRRKIRVE